MESIAKPHRATLDNLVSGFEERADDGGTDVAARSGDKHSHCSLLGSEIASYGVVLNEAESRGAIGSRQCAERLR